ncbi:MAG: hypothetical protein WCH77_00010 [Planctomycetota bacterium]
MLPGRARRDHAVAGNGDRRPAVATSGDYFLDGVAEPAGPRSDRNGLDRSTRSQVRRSDRREFSGDGEIRDLPVRAGGRRDRLPDRP